jgi:hypothetical protein
MKSFRPGTCAALLLLQKLPAGCYWPAGSTTADMDPFERGNRLSGPKA